VHAVIIAGDIYHRKSPSPAEEDAFAEFIARLAEREIHTFAIAGNHERPTAPGRASPLTHIDTLRIPFFHLMDDACVKSVELSSGELFVAGLPWPTRSELKAEGLSPNPLAWDEFISRKVESLAGQIPEGARAVLSAHIWTSTLAAGQGYDPHGEPICRVEVLARPPFSYVALGHIHTHSVQCSSPPVVYSGSIDRTDFTEADEEKGAVMVDIGGDSVSWRFVPTKARKFVTIEMDLRGFPNPVESLMAKAEAMELDGAIVRIVVKQRKGDPPLDGRNIRPKLRDVFYLRVVRNVVSEDEKPLQLKAYTPLGALEEFIDRSEELLPYKEKLIETAAKIAEEATGG